MDTNKLENDAKTVYETARELVEDLGKLGASWVRYGLTVGESSMQASARTLDEVGPLRCARLPSASGRRSP